MRPNVVVSQRCAEPRAEGGFTILLVPLPRTAQHQAPEREPERRPGGRGLTNLSARAAILGGSLPTQTQGGGFELTVQVPLPARTSARLAGDHPPAANDPAHDADEVVGGTVTDQEP